MPWPDRQPRTPSQLALEKHACLALRAGCGNGARNRLLRTLGGSNSIGSACHNVGPTLSQYPKTADFSLTVLGA